MRCNFEWLKQWVPIKVSAQALADSLTMAGLEINALEPVSAPLSGVVVASVVSLQPHPNANKLKLCQVESGDGKPRQVVCGAANVSVGKKVVYAPSGACIAANKIGLKTIRGCQSDGMLCSAAELGLAETSDGIMELDDDAPLGVSLTEYLKLDDNVYDLDLTPNRADCLSVLGIAREVAAIHRCALHAPEQAKASIHSNAARITAKVSEPEACPRYLVREIRGINPTAKTPLAISERLRRCGIRTIHPVVDLLNYLMLELGQPMHAFDSARLHGALRVRWSQTDEQMTVLGGDVVRFDKKTLLIADDRGPLAVAGIVGGEDSSVTAETRDIVLESAFFSPSAILGRARHYNLQTESSHRFERGVDPHLQTQAMEYASALITETLGGVAGPINEMLEQSQLPTRRPILLNLDTLQRQLGVAIEPDFVTDCLSRLGCRLQAVRGGWSCTPPSYRFDLAIEEDLVEEVGRLYGYDQIPAQLNDNTSIKKANDYRAQTRHWADYLSTNGYLEVITYSFISESQLAPFANGLDTSLLKLSNPVSEEMSVMRPSLWPSLLQVLQYNLNRQQERVCIFEQGLKFLVAENDMLQIEVLAGLAYGSALPEQWGVETRRYDFYDLKGDIENLLGPFGDALSFHRTTQRALHPGRCADIFVGDQCIGCLGELAPQLVKDYKLPAPAILFELQTACINEIAVPRYQAVSAYPSLRRDLAFVVAAEIEAASILNCIAELKLDYLIESSLFDIFTEDIKAGSKSVAIKLIFQDLYSTLDKHTIDNLVHNIVVAITDKFNAQLRV